ncbi:unnamed protein product [Caenorhabditis angaria]|uniref:Chondroitin proteoglycan 4 domain-containing protein n=1 Tax=Caenorhabditis angaria TaxID=860376 RepID=A0A9P1IJ49_9PELO|nr:unnamed protein product [Caenorhabditis angaria]
MRFLLILIFSLLTSESLQLDDLETTNVFLRNLLPWWPQEENGLRAASENDTSLVIPLNHTVTTEVPPTLLDLQNSRTSPLDDLKTLPESQKSQINSDNFLINFDDMAECPKDCSTGLRDALSIILQDMSHTERYNKICGKYNEAISCMKEDARCVEEDRGMFEAMTSGLQYMCIEQELAFNATIKCIDDEASLVQSECDNQCQTKNLFMNWVMRSTMQNSIQKGVNDIVGAATGANPGGLAGWADALAQGGLLKQAGGEVPAQMNPQQGFDNFKQLTNDLCRIGDCMLDCIRSKFNTRCEGSAGTLLSEVFVRPIAASQNKLTMLRPVLGMFMPEHCSYVFSSSDLQKHRIDATMDSELKRMYAEKFEKEIKDRAAQDDLLSSIVPLDSNGVPIPGLNRNMKSPLDNSEKTLDQMIMELYSKNDKTSNETETETGNNDENENATDKLIEELMSFNETTIYDNGNSTFSEETGNTTEMLNAMEVTNNSTELGSILENSEDTEAEKSVRSDSGDNSEEGSGLGNVAISEASNSGNHRSSIESSGENSGLESSEEGSGTSYEAVAETDSRTSEGSGFESSGNYRTSIESSTSGEGSGYESYENLGASENTEIELSGDFSGEGSGIYSEENLRVSEGSGQSLGNSLELLGSKLSKLWGKFGRNSLEASGLESSGSENSGEEWISNAENEFEKLIEQL